MPNIHCSSNHDIGGFLESFRNAFWQTLLHISSIIRTQQNRNYDGFLLIHRLSINMQRAFRPDRKEIRIEQFNLSSVPLPDSGPQPYYLRAIRIFGNRISPEWTEYRIEYGRYIHGHQCRDQKENSPGEEAHKTSSAINVVSRNSEILTLGTCAPRA